MRHRQEDPDGAEEGGRLRRASASRSRAPRPPPARFPTPSTARRRRPARGGTRPRRHRATASTPPPSFQRLRKNRAPNTGLTDSRDMDGPPAALSPRASLWYFEPPAGRHEATTSRNGEPPRGRHGASHRGRVGRAPRLPPSVGRVTYLRYCASCHGVHGDGRGPVCARAGPSAPPISAELSRRYGSPLDPERLAAVHRRPHRGRGARRARHARLGRALRPCRRRRLAPSARSPSTSPSCARICETIQRHD
jgi:hypothetical protein